MLSNLLQLASSVHVSITVTVCSMVRNLDRLQRVENSLARVVIQAPDHIPASLSFDGSCTGCQLANASSSNLAPSRSGLSTLVSRPIWLVNCTVINRRGRCALALLPSYIGLTPPSTFTDIPSQSQLRLSGTTSLLPFVILSA